MYVFLGWLIGSLASFALVIAIPGDQGFWAFLIGFSFSLVGVLLGKHIQDKINE